MNKCQPLALGIAIGVLWAVYVFFAGIFATFGWGVALVETLGSFYIAESLSGRAYPRWSTRPQANSNPSCA
jgi:hypothetical protein